MATLVAPPVEKEKERAASPAGRPSVPPLQSGDHLTRVEFERRYRARPDVKKAELVEGVVYMPSPAFIEHAEAHGNVLTWMGVYRASTPGVRSADNLTVRLDMDNEVQPDALLWIDETKGGKARVTADGALTGAPELVVEVAASSAAYDLHEKRTVYRRNGVQEYLVLLAYEREVVWYVLEEERYRPLPADEQGVWRSRVFPGLHLHAQSLWDNDPAGLLATLQAGMETPAHAAFVERLNQPSN